MPIGREHLEGAGDVGINGVRGGCLRLLTAEQVRVLHESTLKLLEDTGVLIATPEIQDDLEDLGASVDRQTDVVRISASVVEEAIKRAPSRIVLHGRTEEHDLTLEGKTVHTHTTGGPAYFFDLETGERRRALKRDIEDAARLVDGLDNIHAYIPLVSPGDVHSRVPAVEMIDAAVRNTTKVVGSPVTCEAEVRFVHRIFAAIAGGETELRENPIGRLSFSPISPLVYNDELGRALATAASLGIPVTILPAPMAGGTAPVTLAGALVQQNAELLAGVTIVQTTNPGTAVILGPRLSIMDMRSGAVSWGAEIGVATACATQLIQSYNLCVDAYGLSSDSLAMDEQAGYEKALNALMAGLAGVNWISGAGSSETLAAASLEQLVIDDDICGMVFRILKGVAVNENTLALDVIDAVGPKGHFISEEHTLEFARSGEQYFPTVSSRLGREQWISQGGKDVVQVARARAKEVLKSHDVPPLPGHVLRELDRIVDCARDRFSHP